MKFKKTLSFFILNFCCLTIIKAQLRENYNASVEFQTIGTTNGTVPFWMRSNKFGSIPLPGASAAVIGSLSKSYQDQSQTDKLYGKKKLIDWGFGVEGRANAGNGSNLQLIEAYGKAKISMFQLKAGRSKDVTGLNGDTTLSSGNFAVAGNALAPPKFEISLPEYWSIPIFNGLFAVKGTFSYGWFGKMTTNPIGKDSTVYDLTTHIHQKSFYGRIGRDDWRLKLFGGFSHQATWGDERKYYGKLYTLSEFQTFAYVVKGKAYHAPGIPGSKIGNQLGSIDVAAEYSFNTVKLKAYRQFFYDIGGLYHLANVRDGLNGITLTNQLFDERDEQGFHWKSILLEFFYSFNQGGIEGSNFTPSGPEDYYNNYFYKQGWSYKNEGLGNPLITAFNKAKAGQAHQYYAFFSNNRVIAWHGGIQGAINDWDFTTKLTFSRNYGTFNTSESTKGTGNIYYTGKTKNVFKHVNQLSSYLETGKNFKNNIYAGVATAVDYGSLLDDSFGIMIKFKKDFK